MSIALHLGALLPAAISVVALVGMRKDAGKADIIAAIFMLVGMTDAMTVSLLSPVVWFAALLTAGLALAAGRRAFPVATARPEAMLSTHLALGLIATATLVLLMPNMAPSAPGQWSGSEGHSHGGASTLPLLLSVGFALGTVLLAAIALRRERSWTHRVHHVTMAASTVAMCTIVAT